ncbi:MULTISPECIES: hypothetical protein [Pseudomonas]|jgi:hypothetical protein|uniref:hypothetical protein n=1 Tax=Pseudomonas TaxID=286 RepID=UPI000B35E886|nr:MULTISPECIES: hypothetical protein [Pseudomonas]PMY56165.1 hypothetical protein C1X70_02910 [Pseudomonas sp. FW305-53]PMY89032.1 hypothetical protein C1X68_01530 [Pseudomonas sp. FW303-C2]PMY92213.1 hypothetical protein C1X67_15225 [Pseudomonas sp. FW305-62]PNA46286.1 hypothetical protein C1X71_02210 [Pseudomonas sp. FW306-2-2C-A10BC]PNA89009.1 hypothetical protein C1X66_02300 [Pseudomonas sp. MPR-R3B]
MDVIYTTVSDDLPIRQGDIIKKKSRAGDTYGLVITADCDIAKGKHKNHYTWIEIIPTQVYMDTRWALEEIERIRVKQIRPVLEFVNKKLKARALSQVSEAKLLDWISEVGVDGFISKLMSEECSADIRDKIEGLFIISTQSEVSALEKIQSAAPLFNLSTDKLIEDARKHLIKDDGFPDFFFLPRLPDELTNGCVALLRHIYSVQDEDIYTCEANARIEDKPNSFFRVCRLIDRVKYSVVQKTTFLFSRIGMTSEFESLTASSAEFSASKIFKEAV